MACALAAITIRSYPLMLRAKCACGWAADQASDAPTFPYEISRAVAAHLGFAVEVMPTVVNTPRRTRAPELFCHGLGEAADVLARRELEDAG